MKWIIECDGNCEECSFEWRNAQYNPDCFFSEIIDFIVSKNKLNYYKEDEDENGK